MVSVTVATHASAGAAKDSNTRAVTLTAQLQDPSDCADNRHGTTAEADGACSSATLQQDAHAHVFPVSNRSAARRVAGAIKGRIRTDTQANITLRPSKGDPAAVCQAVRALAFATTFLNKKHYRVDIGFTIRGSSKTGLLFRIHAAEHCS